MFEMTNENFARLLRGLTIAVGNRKNRIVFYQFLAAEIRALHYSYGIGDDVSYKRAMTFLEECERFTLRSLVRKSAERHVEVTVDHANRVLFAGRRGWGWRSSSLSSKSKRRLFRGAPFSFAHQNWRPRSGMKPTGAYSRVL